MELLFDKYDVCDVLVRCVQGFQRNGLNALSGAPPQSDDQVVLRVMPFPVSQRTLGTSRFPRMASTFPLTCVIVPPTEDPWEDARKESGNEETYDKASVT